MYCYAKHFVGATGHLHGPVILLRAKRWMDGWMDGQTDIQTDR